MKKGGMKIEMKQQVGMQPKQRPLQGMEVIGRSQKWGFDCNIIIHADDQSDCSVSFEFPDPLLYIIRRLTEIEWGEKEKHYKS